MRLELDLTHIKDVRFGPRTEIDGGLLLVGRDALVQLLEQEPLFERVEIELAHPGESCRIIHVLDVLEPRYRINGANFPGALDDFAPVGDGRTERSKTSRWWRRLSLPRDRGASLTCAGRRRSSRPSAGYTM